MNMAVGLRSSAGSLVSIYMFRVSAFSAVREGVREAMTGNAPSSVGVVFPLGIYAILPRGIIKIAIGISLPECSANLLLIVLGYRTGGSVPIFTYGDVKTMVLPLQALTLTAIVIGLATPALLLRWSCRFTGITGPRRPRIGG